MAFIDKIGADLVAAMRSRDQVRLGTLRMAKAALMNREVERGGPLDDGESLQVPLTRDHLSVISGITEQGRLLVQMQAHAFNGAAVAAMR